MAFWFPKGTASILHHLLHPPFGSVWFFPCPLTFYFDYLCLSPWILWEISSMWGCLVRYKYNWCRVIDKCPDMYYGWKQPLDQSLSLKTHDWPSLLVIATNSCHRSWPKPIVGNHWSRTVGHLSFIVVGYYPHINHYKDIIPILTTIKLLSPI